MKTVEITKHKMAASGQAAQGTWATFMDIYRREGIRGINKGVNAVAYPADDQLGLAVRPCRAWRSRAIRRVSVKGNTTN